MKSKFSKILWGATFLLSLASMARAEVLYFLDSDNSGSEFITLVGTTSYDADGGLIDYEWRVNNTLIQSGYTTPLVADFGRTYNVGSSTVTLTVRDDAQAPNTYSVNVILLPASANLPPVAQATVPPAVQASTSGIASVLVNASASFDPENDPIYRYRWTEGATVYYDGASAITTLNLSGLGAHALQLRVYSVDPVFNAIQSGTNTYTVQVNALSQGLAGRNFSRSVGTDFSFNPPNEDFAGITFNALTQTYYVTDNETDKVFEIQPDGTLIRTIDVAPLKDPAVATADPEGIAWMYGTTYALALQEADEVAIVNIVSTTTVLNRNQARIVDVSPGPGGPKGLTYSGREDAFYWVTRDTPKAIIKARINPSNQNWETVWEQNVDVLPVTDLSDVAVFPRLSPNLFLISESSKTILEVEVTPTSAIARSSFSLTSWPIPQGSGLSFGVDGSFRVVTKSSSGVPEDDFNIFVPTSPLPNLPPTPRITKPDIGQGASAIDINGDGREEVLVDATGSVDPDGFLIDYEWFVNGQSIRRGFGPGVENLRHLFDVGYSTVSLVVRDDVQVSSQVVAVVRVLPQSNNQPPVAEATVPAQVIADNNGTGLVFVDASLSFDPDNDPISRYRWTESTTTLYDGAYATATLSVSGLGQHQIVLTVYSTDSSSITQSGFKDFFFRSLEVDRDNSRVCFMIG